MITLGPSRHRRRPIGKIKTSGFTTKTQVQIVQKTKTIQNILYLLVLEIHLLDTVLFQHSRHVECQKDLVVRRKLGGGTRKLLRQ